MAKIDRYNGNLKAFASDATGTERTIFGDTAQSDELDANITADLLRGWGVVGPTFNPTKQDFNGLGFTLGQLIAYLHQQGIPEWNTSQEYYRGSVVTTLAGIYRLKNGGDATVDPDNDNGTNWELAPTRAQVDAKANQATTYTKTEANSLLDAKADQATTYTKTEAAVDFGATTADLDTLVKSGFYRIQENANRPSAADYGQLIVSRGGDTILQIASNFAGRLWQRSGNPSNVGGNGSYSDWQEIPSQATTYTETEVDSLLDAKANQATTYTKTEAAVDFGSTTDDLDTVVKSGFYRIQENANLPPGADYGQLIVSRGEDTILQLVSDFGGRLWQRSGNPSNTGGNGSYSDWQEIPSLATTYTKTEVDDLVATRTESPDETAITGTATFTNLTNNIALTGIGSIGLEIGDVVQVTGTASNNKLFTVEVITDSGNVIVNQAHAGGTTTKSLVDETVSATVTLIAKWFNAPASLGQGWVEVTPSRSLGSNFTNATKRAIQVAVNFTQTGSGSITRSFRINGAAVQKATEFQTGILRTLGAVLVPNADTYGIDSGTGVSLDSWLELR